MSFVARHVIVHRPPPNAVSVSSVSLARDLLMSLIADMMQTHWAVPLMSILRFFAGVLEHLDVRQARRFLLHVLNPIHRILDESGDLAVEAGSQMGQWTALPVGDVLTTRRSQAIGHRGSRLCADQGGHHRILQSVGRYAPKGHRETRGETGRQKQTCKRS